MRRTAKTIAIAAGAAAAASLVERNFIAVRPRMRTSHESCRHRVWKKHSSGIVALITLNPSVAAACTAIANSAAQWKKDNAAAVYDFFNVSGETRAALTAAAAELHK
jgi:hypothetical protein